MEAIVRQVKQCPLGALRVESAEPEPVHEGVRAFRIPDGPLIIRGYYVLQRADGREETYQGQTAFCCCGAAALNPFCDGSHLKVGFKG